MKAQVFSKPSCAWCERAVTYITEKDIDVERIEIITEDGEADRLGSITTHDSFVAQVWNKTLGGALPFMFQPDSNNYNNIYMCKFNQSSLKVEQVAAKTYSVSLNITEVW